MKSLSFGVDFRLKLGETRAPNTAIWHINVPTNMKMSFIWKDVFFFGESDIIVYFLVGPSSEAKKNRGN